MCTPAKKLYTLAFHRLVSGMYLLPSNRTSHLSPMDRLFKFEEEERSQVKGIPTAKQLKEVQEIARSKFNAEQNELFNLALVCSLLSYQLYI
jgi:hypothetical protein